MRLELIVWGGLALLLMAKLAKKVGDGRVLKLIRRYLEAGMMAEGVISPRDRKSTRLNSSHT